MAEEGEIVLAQANKSALISAKAGHGEVIITSREKGWYQWAKQVKKSSPARILVPFKGERMNWKEIIEAYTTAAKRIKSKGMLIISAGHGGRQPGKGWVDLAPHEQMRLSTDHFELKEKLAGRDKELMKHFLKIGDILKKHKVLKVFFISCNVGRSHEFLQHIADDWQVTVGGYADGIEIEFVTISGKRWYYIFLTKNPPKTEAEKRRCMNTYPAFEFGGAWWIVPSKSK